MRQGRFVPASFLRVLQDAHVAPIRNIATLEGILTPTAGFLYKNGWWVVCRIVPVLISCAQMRKNIV